jgi:hypothetical protein
MKTVEIKHHFVVLEQLPWLENPRIITGFNSQEEAEAEVQRLNSKSLDSSFLVIQLGHTFDIGFMEHKTYF